MDTVIWLSDMCGLMCTVIDCSGGGGLLSSLDSKSFCDTMTLKKGIAGKDQKADAETFLLSFPQGSVVNVHA